MTGPRVFGVPPGSPPGTEPTNQGYLTYYDWYDGRSNVWVLSLPTGGARILDRPGDAEWLRQQDLLPPDGA